MLTAPWNIHVLWCGAAHLENKRRTLGNGGRFLPRVCESRLPGTRAGRNDRRQVATRPNGIIHESEGALIDDVTMHDVHCAVDRLQVFIDVVPVRWICRHSWMTIQKNDPSRHKSFFVIIIFIVITTSNERQLRLSCPIMTGWTAEVL